MKVRRMLRKVRKAAFFVVAVTMLGTVLGPTSSAMANTARSNNDPYSYNKWLAFPELGICLNYKLTGNITYIARRYGPTASGYIQYKVDTIQVVAPKMSMAAYRYDSVSHGCTSRPAYWSKLTAAQVMRVYSCSYNPTISVQAPFGVGVSFWPSCGSKKVGQWVSTYGRASWWQQHNTTGRVRYGAQSWYQPATSPKPKPACYAVVARFHAYVPGNDDVKDSGRLGLCLTPQW